MYYFPYFLNLSYTEQKTSQRRPRCKIWQSHSEDSQTAQTSITRMRLSVVSKVKQISSSVENKMSQKSLLSLKRRVSNNIFWTHIAVSKTFKEIIPHNWTCSDKVRKFYTLYFRKICFLWLSSKWLILFFSSYSFWYHV